MANSLRLLVIAVMLATASALGMIGLQIVHPARHGRSDATTPMPTKVTYLVASRALPVGTVARTTDLAAKSAAADAAPAGAIVDSPEARAGLRGAWIRVPLAPGQPITRADFLAPDGRGVVARMLPGGLCAISIAVDPVTGVSGLIAPGDHVNVILTQTLDAQPLAQRVLSETILSDLHVLAVDQRLDARQAGKVPTGLRSARTLTLAVTPTQANQLTVAAQIGRLTFALRGAVSPPPAGTAITPTYSADVSPALARKDKPVGQTVLVIEGNARRQVVFQ